ncbi:MAG: hypothetical protein RIB45_10615 [Marivibrio sp.]|uniref:hypothetical protein n=1 Tax=Marivibrio sp. TaxID=2039719 RepID=UPI0032EBD693
MRKILLTAAALAFAAPLLWAAGVAALEARGREAAREFAADLDLSGAPERAAQALTARIFETYSAPSDGASQPLLLRLRPFLSNRLLPEPLRVAPGAIEAIHLTGHCDAAARSLAYVLRVNGVPAAQMNLIGAAGEAHTIVRADLPGRGPALLDPHTGLAPKRHGRLLGEAEAKRLQRAGVPAESVWRPLSERARFHSVFRRFPDLAVVEQGAPFEWRRPLSLDGRERLMLGALDGASDDVGDAAAAQGLGVYWTYLGHRYDRGWTRTLVAEEAMRITFHLLDDPRPGVVTSDRTPRIDGRRVVYELAVSETLSLHDGRATISLTRLNSFIGVDAIEVEARSEGRGG